MVYAIDVVAPDDVEFTYPTRNQTLTLITCTTWDAFRGIFEERLAIRAVPVRIMDIQAGA
jgi:sortase (surface protein transpeptidase)